LCPTKNESITINCAAIDEKTFCPEPIESRIGAGAFACSSNFCFSLLVKQFFSLQTSVDQCYVVILPTSSVIQKAG
jgi:hypothetical protein